MADELERWVEETARITGPQRVEWCDGSEEENTRLIEGMLNDGTLHELSPDRWPHCYLHRSNPNDVARTEHLTFICSDTREQAGPTNNWMAPGEARQKVGALFEGAMKDRTMYVVPYLMGPPGSPFSKVGVEITDSPYVVANMRVMTRMGKAALEQYRSRGEFAPGLHSLGDLSPERRFICHFPEERLIWSVGSGYGGNALLGKKCFALRIASTIAREEGWLAEHMLILELEQPGGKTDYIAAAFPSACGKTNLAMLVSPLERLGYKVRTVGDDIAWLRVGEDGRLWAVNPEAGFFGVAPGTNDQTNPNAMKTIRRNTIFTNVAMTGDAEPWWEGRDSAPPQGLVDWQNKPYTGTGKAAHPNSRYTTPARQCPSISPRWEDPKGVPISAFIFGGRRARLTPLVYQSYNWKHGVFVAATMGSETTAAATGQVGVVRRDPMAMLPFCGYNMADYWGHWLAMGERASKPPAIFHANWFRTDADGRFLWPGFGENLRVLLWILERTAGEGKAEETPIGWVPTPDALNLEGLDVTPQTMKELMYLNEDDWKKELTEIKPLFEKFGDRLPQAMKEELKGLAKRLGEA
jgi:phosphoenolpyruvate carboxykinase (GTP)